MRGYMFRNRWFSLVFVGLVLVGVANLVGTEEGGGTLGEMREQFARQTDQTHGLDTESELPEVSDDVHFEFIDDEELIDPATGYDPTPIDPVAALPENGATVAPDTQFVIVQQDGGQEAEQ